MGVCQRIGAVVCLREKFADGLMIGWVVNISKTGQVTGMAMLKISTTIKSYEGLTVKGGCRPADDLVENQIF